MTEQADVQGKLIAFAAPSGAGKTTIVREILAKMPSLAFAVSATTRPPRENEVDGVHYYFIDQNWFQEKVNNNEFI